MHKIYNASEISLIGDGYELQVAYVTSYVTHQAIMPNRLRKFRLLEFATLRQEFMIHHKYQAQIHRSFKLDWEEKHFNLDQLFLS